MNGRAAKVARRRKKRILETLMRGDRVALLRSDRGYILASAISCGVSNRYAFCELCARAHFVHERGFP